MGEYRFRVYRFRVYGFRVQGSGFRVQGSGFRVQGCGGGFAANIYGAMPEGRREEVRSLMSDV